jgi:hypothetical protein
MKRTFFGALILFCVFSIEALELSVMGGAGNMDFDTERKTAIGNGDFENSFYPFGYLQLEENYLDLLKFTGTFERDPVLKNRASAEAEFQTGYFSISGGPLFGIFNSDRMIQPGFLAGFGIDVPGIFYIKLKGGSTIGDPRSVGDYAAKNGELTLGFWLPNIVNTVSISGKTYQTLEANNLFITNEIQRYQYSTDIHAKSASYKIRLDFGIETLKQRYEDSTSSEEDTYNICFIGAETSFNVRPSFRLIFGVEIPFYSWGENPLTRPANAWSFEAHAGFSVTIDPVTN